MPPSQLFPWANSQPPTPKPHSSPPKPDRPFQLFPGLRSRSATAASVASTSTTRTTSSRFKLAPRTLSKELGVTQPSITLTHAEPTMAPIDRAGRKPPPQRASSGSSLGKGKEREGQQPHRSLSEEALVQQMEREGRGERMSMMLRGRGGNGDGGDSPTPVNSPISPDIHPTATVETMQPPTDPNPTSTQSPTPPLPIPPIPTTLPPQPEAGPSTIRRLGSWMGNRNNSRPSSIKVPPPSTPVEQPIPEVEPAKPDPAPLIIGSIDSGPTVPGGLAIKPNAPSRVEGRTGIGVEEAEGVEAPAGWWGYLGYKSISRAEGRRVVEGAGIVPPVPPPPAALEAVSSPVVAEVEVVPPIHDPLTSHSVDNGGPINPLETVVGKVVGPESAVGVGAPGWSGYLKSWVVPEIPVPARPAAVTSIPSVPASIAETVPDSSVFGSELPSQAVTVEATALSDANLAAEQTYANMSRTAWLFSIASKAVQSRQTTITTVPAPLMIKSAEAESAVPPLASGSAAPPSPTPAPATPTAPSAPRSTPIPSPAKNAMGPPAVPSGISQSYTQSPILTARPNLILPTFDHMFNRPPRSLPSHGSQPEPSTAPPPPVNKSLTWLTLGSIGSMGAAADKSKLQVPVPPVEDKETRGKGAAKGIGGILPRVDKVGIESWEGVRRVVVVGVHGWFPNKNVQIVTGVPRSSAYFASMMGQAVLAQFEADHGIAEQQLEKMTYIPLEGEGTIDVRVDKLFKQYLSRPEWISDLRRADAIFFAAHSQGCIVTAHLIYRLVAQGHLRTTLNAEAVSRCEWAFGPIVLPDHAKNGTRRPGLLSRGSEEPEGKPQKISLLGMCGVHLGPFFSINSSTVLQPYLWFENAAAKELFDFQDTASTVSVSYHRSLTSILDNGVKVVLLSSLDDQMVPIYSASFSSATHPLILRALYVDSSSYSSSDFMANLLIFCLMLRNAGLDDQGLVGHLSEVTAGGLRGVGHSAPYEDLGGYTLLVKYALQTSTPSVPPGQLEVEPFTARDAKNDFELPWILRGVMDDPMVKDLFAEELKELKEGILDWRPNTRALKDIKKRLEPMAGKVALRNQRLLRSPSAVSLASSEGKKDGERTTPVGSFVPDPMRRPSNAGGGGGLGQDW